MAAILNSSTVPALSEEFLSAQENLNTSETITNMTLFTATATRTGIPISDYMNVLHYLNNQYRKVHGELSFSVCVFGVITNILNIIVLSR